MSAAGRSRSGSEHQSGKRSGDDMAMANEILAAFLKKTL
jgi:hypothetical protein